MGKKMRGLFLSIVTYNLAFCFVYISMFSQFSLLNSLECGGDTKSILSNLFMSFSGQLFWSVILCRMCSLCGSLVVVGF